MGLVAVGQERETSIVAGKSVLISLTSIVLLVLATTAGAWLKVYLPFTPVPLTMQTFAVLLGAALLGSRDATIAQALYLVLGSFAAPIFFAGATPLAPYLLGPTGGYLIGFIAASVFVGVAIKRQAKPSTITVLAIFIAGTALIFIPGVAFLMAWAEISLTSALALGCLPFLAGAAAKIIAATVVFQSTQKWRNF